MRSQRISLPFSVHRAFFPIWQGTTAQATHTGWTHCMPHGVNPTIPKTILATLSSSYLRYSSKPTRTTSHLSHPTSCTSSQVPLFPSCDSLRHACSTFPPTHAVECSTPAGAANGRYFSLSALSHALATCEETERRRSSSYLTRCQDLGSGGLRN